jgi:hypothetical protein
MRNPGYTQCTERVIAVDWSGARVGAERHLWLAEARDAQSLVRLEAGRGREPLVTHLIDEARRAPPLVVGLDFAFAFPAWFSRQLGARTALELWQRVASDAEAWLLGCEPPFWGRPGRARPASAGSAWRWTERVVPRVAGVAPKSVFQIGGAGAVGTGSLRGMPLLDRLHRAGAAVWPFEAARAPLVVVEIYPRLLTGPVAKSSAVAREAFLDTHYPGLAEHHRRQAIDSPDALDAAVSALAMAAHRQDLVSLPAESDPLPRLEGRIWHPDWRLDGLRCSCVQVR